jgi:inhibitor of KinA
LKIETTTLPYETVCEELTTLLEGLSVDQDAEPRIVEIPVCYGGEFGPDLEEVAEHNGITPEEVIDIHSNGEYIVYMIGFAPGFPYIGGMSEKIAAPRRKNPRLKIPAGSVGIAGKQTGVYPIETPGGWQLIGRTPRKLFLPDGHTPSLLQAGDQIKFVQVSQEEFLKMEEDEK